MPHAMWREPLKQFQNPENGRKYERGKLLGEGAYGRVYACREVAEEEKFFAVKIVDARTLISKCVAEKELKKLHREAVNMQKVDAHPCILKFEESFGEPDDWVYFVTELVIDAKTKRSVDLHGHLIANGKRLSEEVARKIFRQIVIGVRHLHAANVIHRDIKLENVLVYGPASDLQIKIIDFGWSKEIGPGMSVAKSMAGSPHYMSPQIKDPKTETHDFQTDLWSLGIVLFVMLNAAFTQKARAAGTAAGATQEEIDAEVRAVKHLSEDARSVILGLLRIDPAERISLEELLQHPWLAPPAPKPPRSNKNLLQRIGDVIGLTGSSQSVPTGDEPPEKVRKISSSPGDEPPEKVRKIMELGFKRDMAEVALASTHDDVEAAVNKLIEPTKHVK